MSLHNSVRLRSCQSLRRLDGAHLLVAVLLAAGIAAVAAVVERVISSGANGGLLAGWMLLWALVFLALALFGGTVRALALRGVSGWRLSSRRPHGPPSGG